MKYIFYNLYDLASCIDNNDNHMTFVRQIVFLCPLKHHFHPRSAWAQMMLHVLGPQINYMPEKNHVIVVVLLSTKNTI